MVLCQSQKKVLGELVEAELLAGPSQAVNLHGGLHCGVDQELLESCVLLHGFGHLFQVTLNGVQGFLLVGSREESSAVPSLDAIDGDGGLDQGLVGSGELPRQNREIPGSHVNSSSELSCRSESSNIS